MMLVIPSLVLLNGRYRVYIDPYFANAAAKQYFVVGYKGTSPYDAGVFYCPYVPLQMVRAVGENSFQPKIGFKTRYGLAQNPFSTSDATDVHLVQTITSTIVEFKSSTLCNNKSWVNQPIN